jgi:tetratricopeptide (TPR) repeat protein
MYDLALKDYTRAIALKPDYASAFVNRGMCYFATNQYKEAAQDFTRALELNPQDEGAREKMEYMKKANLL